MGSILIAECDCGFKSKEIYAGGGVANFETECAAPAVCKNCSSFLVLNYLRKKNKCPNCKSEVTFYNDPSIQKKTNTENTVFDWYFEEYQHTFVLPDTKYYCPKCKKFNLRFISLGCWD